MYTTVWAFVAGRTRRSLAFAVLCHMSPEARAKTEASAACLTNKWFQIAVTIHMISVFILGYKTLPTMLAFVFVRLRMRHDDMFAHARFCLELPVAYFACVVVHRVFHDMRAQLLFRIEPAPATRADDAVAMEIQMARDVALEFRYEIALVAFEHSGYAVFTFNL